MNLETVISWLQLVVLTLVPVGDGRSLIKSRKYCIGLLQPAIKKRNAYKNVKLDR